MGYGSTIMMILFGMTVAFYLYANVISDPITQIYARNISTDKLSNVSNQSQTLNRQMQDLGIASGSNYSYNLLTNTATGSFIGLLGGGIASLLTGGGFASIYIVPAVVLGGFLGMLTQPLDTINSILIGLPVEVGFIFKTFTYILVFIFVLAWIRGDF